MSTRHNPKRPRGGSWTSWLPAWIVALGAASVTAHGLFEVAVAAAVPARLAWLYPLITDGLALVAYAATHQLAAKARAYAWCVVVLAAGVSGLAQAVYLASGVGSAPPVLRFGVGAWPAIAAAIVAHLLFLLGTATRERRTVLAERPTNTATGSNVQRPNPDSAVRPTPVQQSPVQQTPVQRPAVQPSGVQPSGVQPSGVQPRTVQPAVHRDPVRPSDDVQSSTSTAEHSAGRQLPSPARDRAVTEARQYLQQHGRLPSVRDLVATADVGQGTAAQVLKDLREQPPALHLVTEPNHHDETIKAQP